MSKVDWSKAPGGAEFYADGIFYAKNGVLLYWAETENKWVESISNIELLRSLWDYQPRPPIPVKSPEWPAEQRIDIVGTNGGDGMHYDDQREAQSAQKAKEIVAPALGHQSKPDAIQSDLVNSPKHYRLVDELEAIDVIERTLTPEQFKGYLIGNFLKYRLRAGNKDDALQDLAKSEWYRQRAAK
jgi:hypothetical protein